VLLGGGSPAPDYQSYRANPTPAIKAQIAAYAKTHAKEQSGALANFALGMTSFAQKNYTDAQQYLLAAQPLLPRLADYVSFYIASAKAQFNDDTGVARELAPFPNPVLPLSPLAPQLTLLQAKALIHTHAFLTAIKVLREAFDGLPQPDGDLALAQAYEGQGELAQAAVLYQRVYFTHPATPLAVDAAAAIERLKKSMAKAYPPPMPQQMLTRGDQWLARKQYAKAKEEFRDMLAQLGGVERDQAAVRIGVADLLGGNGAAASRYWKELHLAHSEADAERLYYIGEAARRANDDSGVQTSLKELDKHYPDSVWRLKALLAAGNAYLAARQPERALPLFRAASDKFPPDPSTAFCHWKVAWDAYLKGSSDAADLMKGQLTKYPDDQRAASALYFLGRLAEESNDFAAARAYYERLQAVFPHYYYGMLGSEKLAGAHLAEIKPSADVVQALDQVAFPERIALNREEATPATLAHADRARLLYAAGFADWAETELRFGANTDGQRHLLALELAKSDPTLALSLRHMKVLTPEYLALDYDRAPKEVWGYLFPLPLQKDLVRTAKERNLDPYLVAGLIRQESEFNPAVVSRAHAFGLMQLLPSTGKMIARQEGIVSFQSSMLFDPLVSLKLGTFYLRAQLDRWNGSIEQTLAAYNAGPGRVQQWTSGAQFREPAEFVESIPFTETREYVQSVMRNAMVYRQLYASTSPPPQPLNALTSSHVSAPGAATAATRSGTSPKRTVARKRAS
jgi:soluble lytic murein transglycosylase